MTEPQPAVEQPPAVAPVIPDRQTVYRSCNVEVQRVDDGMVLVITWRPTGEQLLFPMPTDVAQTIGRQLAAPRVVIPGTDTNGGTPS